jgi:hypothetical protein
MVRGIQQMPQRCSIAHLLAQGFVALSLVLVVDHLALHHLKLQKQCHCSGSCTSILR